MPQTTLKTMQLGIESVWGTPVACTSKLMLLEDVTATVVQKTEVFKGLGEIGPSATAVMKEMHAEGNLSVVASYEDLLYIFQSLFGTGSTGSTTAPYTWTYTAPVSTTPTPIKYTAEIGAPSALYRMEGMLFSDIALSGEAGDVWKAKCSILGEVISATSAHTALSDRVVNPIRMADTSLFVDAWSGTAGATAMPTALTKFALDYKPGRHLKQFAGALTPGSFGDNIVETELTMQVEYNATAKAVIDDLLTPNMVQRIVVISATQGGGATLKSAQLVCPGTLIDNQEMFPDRDGNIVADWKWSLTKNSTLTTYLKINIRNGMSSAA